MARLTDNSSDAMDQLIHELSEVRTGMLWVKGSGQHPQPMTHYVDKDGQTIWFITSSDTDLVGEITHGAESGYMIVSGDGDYHASIAGPLVISEDEAKLDELWSFAASAWFEQGREDPKVTLLKFTPREASVWASEGNPVIVGLKMMRAAMQDGTSEPDVGRHHVLNFHFAA